MSSHFVFGFLCVYRLWGKLTDVFTWPPKIVPLMRRSKYACTLYMAHGQMFIQ